MSAIPVLALMAGGAALASLASSKKAKGAAAASSGMVELDATMGAQLEGQVLAAIQSSNDPAALNAFAAQVDAMGFHLGAAALRQRAGELAAMVGPVNPSAAAALGQLDPNIPAALLAQLTALLASTDPAQAAAMTALATQVDGMGFHLAAAALRQRATFLSAATSAVNPAAAALLGLPAKGS
jgi:hypothetical protein